jgi:hypothetical protein
MNSTFGGIPSELSDDRQNEDDSIRLNSEFDPNEFHESDLQHEKHDDPRM